MDNKDLLEYCLGKKGAYLDFPFGDWYAVVKIRTSEKRHGYIFAEFFEQNGEEKFTFSTSAEDAEYLREAFPSTIVRGWHCPPVQAKYKSTAIMSQVDENMLKKLADVSYERAYSKLTAKEREAL